VFPNYESKADGGSVDHHEEVRRHLFVVGGNSADLAEKVDQCGIGAVGLYSLSTLAGPPRDPAANCHGFYQGLLPGMQCREETGEGTAVIT